MQVETPVTCFSRSPLITPMWAHYASNSEGFVAEIDEDALAEWVTAADFGHAIHDITYTDQPAEGMEMLLHKAYVISKFRHVDWLQKSIRRAAYFNKQTCWSYEQERRMILQPEALTEINSSLRLLFAPSRLISRVIVGGRASTDLKERMKKLCAESGWQYLEKRFGRSTTMPYFIGEDGSTYTVQEDGIAAQRNRCSTCLEPSRPPERVLGASSLRLMWSMLLSEIPLGFSNPMDFWKTILKVSGGGDRKIMLSSLVREGADMDAENEIIVGQVVYAFTSAGMAKGFEECLNKGTLATCKEDWQPTGIYPPAILDTKAL